MNGSYLFAIIAISKQFFPSWSAFVWECATYKWSLFQPMRLNINPRTFASRAIIFHWKTNMQCKNGSGWSMSISSAILWYAGNGNDDRALENLIGLFGRVRALMSSRFLDRVQFLSMCNASRETSTRFSKNSLDSPERSALMCPNPDLLLRFASLWKEVTRMICSWIKAHYYLTGVAASQSDFSLQPAL